ncbi:MAG: (Fe-S)-binding protein [Desulfobacteraceae bacterium]|nr:MAG: (Fe-S)-binding protein [Desulfobacteraceae bacterium]
MTGHSIKDIVGQSRVSGCLSCGKCSAVCPITKYETQVYASPRLFIEKVLTGKEEEVWNDVLFQSCLTCERCEALCSSDVHFSEFIRDLRAEAFADGRAGPCTHGDAVKTWARIMTDPGLRQNRLEWLAPDLKTSRDADILFFTGCLPYYDVLFKHLGVEGVEIARNGLKILNHFGIEPQVLSQEVCCGHDFLWQGEVETFRKLAALNLERLKSAKIKTIITTCPECAYTLKTDYPKYMGGHDFKVMHFSQWLDAQVKEKGNPFKNRSDRPAVTFQDPCRLGRFQGIYEEPRHLLRNLGLTLKEMDSNRETALCCGTSCWTHCGQTNKTIQTQRLQQAKATGSGLLVTACVKCQIHLRCAQIGSKPEEGTDIAIQDLTTLLAECL